jgi:exopolysaccharide biosynthesis protein
MKWSLCDESGSSSSEDDVRPFLPEESSALSTIEESCLENGVESDSYSSTSEYLSSLLDQSISNISTFSVNENQRTSAKNESTSSDEQSNNQSLVSNFDDNDELLRIENEIDANETRIESTSDVIVST